MADGEESQSAVQPTQVGVSDVAPVAGDFSIVCFDPGSV